MRRLPLWSAAWLLSLGLLQSTWAQPAPILIRFSHVTTADTPKGRAAEFFRMRAEDLTRGRVKVEVYPNATLIKDPDEFKALQEDRVQMLAPPLSKFGSLGVKEFEVFDVPYLFANRQVVQKVMVGAVGKDLFRKLDARGVHGMAYWDNGFKVMSSNRPLALPADLKGVKLRIQNSRVIEAQMRALGADPKVMTLAETFAALQSGAIEGTENPPSNMYSQRIHELQKYAADTNHGYLGYAVIVSKVFWDGLPADIRPLLDQAMRDATRYANSIAQQENEDALAVVERSGKTRVTRLTEAQRKQWQQALLPVRKDAEARVGAEFMALMTREVQAAGGQ
jgi:C4-dicarboxylate-binding protein DctP